MSKILENQHEARIERENNALEDAALMKRLGSELEKGQYPYSRQWRGWYLGAVFFGYIGGGLSFITESFAIGYLFFFDALPSSVAWVIAGCVGIGLAVLVEWMKRGANDKFFFTMVFRRKFAGAAFSKMVFIMVISITASGLACVLIPQVKNKVASSVQLISMDSIKMSYEPRIAAARQSLELYQKEGRSSLAGKADAELSKLYAQQDTALARADRENTRRESVAATDAESWGWLLLYVSCGLEVLFMLAFWYSKNYLYNCALERGLLGKADDDRRNDDRIDDDRIDGDGKIPFEDGEPRRAPELEVERVIIKGFKNDDRIDDDRIDGKTEIVKPGLRICPTCQTQFEHKHWNKTFCSDKCRKEAWEKKTGKPLKFKKGGK